MFSNFLKALMQENIFTERFVSSNSNFLIGCFVDSATLKNKLIDLIYRF